jgi:hypothetical protein
LFSGAVGGLLVGALVGVLVGTLIVAVALVSTRVRRANLGHSPGSPGASRSFTAGQCHVSVRYLALSTISEAGPSR